jgi:OTU domain-containing protein 6
MLIRSICANYMLQHRHQFEPFIAEDESKSFEEYCAKVKNTSEWGGQLELRALASALKLPILVITGHGDDIIMGEEYLNNDTEPLRLTYHHHYLSLGEHYNSTEPLTKSSKNEGSSLLN